MTIDDSYDQNYRDPDADPIGDNQSNVDPEDAMDQAAKSSKGFEQIPAGNYSAVVDKIVKWVSPKGTACWRIDLYCYVDEEQPAFKHAIFCHMLEADGRTPHKGAGFYAQHMAVLGYDKDHIGKTAREEIEREKPGIAISINPQKDNPQYNNTKIKGLLGDDNQEIQAIREAIALF
jgi:hypothetical protein